MTQHLLQPGKLKYFAIYPSRTGAPVLQCFISTSGDCLLELKRGETAAMETEQASMAKHFGRQTKIANVILVL